MRIPPAKAAVIAFVAAIFLAGPASARPSDLPSAITPRPSPSPQRLRNISARASVQTGTDVLIAGFIINGASPKRVILRAIGPSLNINGAPVLGRLADPTLELYSSSGIRLVANNDWRETQQSEIEATGLAPSNGLEATIVATLEPGSYTAILRGKNGGTGIGLIEAYDLDAPSDLKLANISTRGLVGLGNDVLIGGVIVGGGGSEDTTIRLVVRAIAPSLRLRGIPNALDDPALLLYDSNGTLIASNDDWETTQGSDISETNLAPADAKESALIVLLGPGAYTAIVRGKNQTGGVALIEFYDAPIPLLNDPA